MHGILAAGNGPGMRRTTGIVLAAVAALVAAGTGVAELRHSESAAAVSATFAAGGVEKRATETCSGADGSLQVTNAVYTGRAAGDPALAGAVKIAVRASINTVKAIGTLDGFLAAGSTRAHLTGVYKDGRVTGFLGGTSGGRRLTGTFTASWATDDGFTNGTIGSGSAAPLAVLTSDGDCTTGKRPDETG